MLTLWASVCRVHHVPAHHRQVYAGSGAEGACRSLCGAGGGLAGRSCALNTPNKLGSCLSQTQMCWWWGPVSNWKPISSRAEESDSVDLCNCWLLTAATHSPTQLCNSKTSSPRHDWRSYWCRASWIFLACCLHTLDCALQTDLDRVTSRIHFPFFHKKSNELRSILAMFGNKFITISDSGLSSLYKIKVLKYAKAQERF